MSLIKYERIRFKEPLGKGSFGTVFPYRNDDPNDNKWVVKHITATIPEELNGCITELVLGYGCEHPNVLPVRGHLIRYEEPNWNVYIKLPKMQGSLKSIIDEHKRSKEPIQQEKIIKYFYQTAKGLQYLHSRNIAHRDIKPDNVLVDKDDIVKVSDFGLGNFIGDISSKVLVDKVGALFYAAPENLDPNIRLETSDLPRTDLWSLGILVLELCTLDVRFLDFNGSGDKKEADLKKKVEELRGKYDDVLLELISGLLRSKPEERKGLKYVQEVLENNYPHIIEMEKKDQEIQVETKELNFIDGQDVREIRSGLKDIFQKVVEIKQLNQEGFQEVRGTLAQGGKQQNFSRIKLLVLVALLGIIFSLIPERFSNPSFSETRKGFEAATNGNLRDLPAPLANHVEPIQSGSKFEHNSLQEISIKQKNCNWLNSQTSKNSLDRLTGRTDYQNITRFSLTLLNDCKKLDNQMLEDLFAQIGVSLPNLTHLSLECSECNYIGGSKFQELVFWISQYYGNLQLLSLNFKRIQLSDIIVSNMISNINQNFEKVQSLSLNFLELNLTPRLLKELDVSTKENLKNLYHLSLRLGSSSVGFSLSAEDINKLISKLGQNLENLESLSFGFDRYNINPNGFKEIASQIHSSFPQLKTLALDFGFQDLDKEEDVKKHFKNSPIQNIIIT